MCRVCSKSPGKLNAHLMLTRSFDSPNREAPLQLVKREAKSVEC